MLNKKQKESKRKTYKEKKNKKPPQTEPNKKYPLCLLDI